MAMQYFMMVEPLIRGAYWSSLYSRGIQEEIKRVKGTLNEIGVDELHRLTDYAGAHGLRPVLMVNCISRQWIYDCVNQLGRREIHPLLLVPGVAAPSLRVSSVSFDFAHVFYDLCQYLYNAKRRNIALFGVNPDSANDAVKHGAFAAFTQDYAGAPASDAVFWNRGCLEDCCEAFYRRVGEFNAVVCSNDVVAVKLLGYLKEHGVGVPDDVYMATVGNTELSRFITPDITVSDFQCGQVGRQAARLCAMLARNADISYISATITGEILPRKSTDFCPVKKDGRTFAHSVQAENINFYSDEDVSRIFSVERLLSGCDELDVKILSGLLCGERIAQMAQGLYVSENTVKYRIRKMQALTGTTSRIELTALCSRYFC